MSKAVGSGLFVLGLAVTPVGGSVAVAVEEGRADEDAWSGLVAEDADYLAHEPEPAAVLSGADVSGCSLVPCIVGFSSLSDTSGQSGDAFGSSIAALPIDTSGNVGDLLVVGAPARAGGTGPGAAYLFARANYGWIKQREFTTSPTSSGSQFGASVTVTRNFNDGALVVVGGPSSDTSGLDAGVYLTARAPFTAPQNYGFTLLGQTFATAPGARTGESVALDNTTLAVAVPGQDRVTVYTRSFPWAVEDQLPVPLGAGTASGYGAAMDLAGDLIAVGAPFADDGTAIDAGAVYLFRRIGGVWINEAKLIDPSGRTDDGFGRTVAVGGNIVVVGAPGAPGVGGALAAGRAYAFERVGTTWMLRTTLFAPDGQPGDGFGRFVAVDGNRIVVGAPGDDFGAHVDRGSGYLFLRAGDLYLPAAKLVANELSGVDRSNDRLGTAGALTRTEAILGAPGARSFNGGATKGVAIVFPTGLATLRETPRPTTTSDADDNTGASTAIAGDWMVAGTPNDDPGGLIDRGSVNFYQRVGGVWQLQQTVSPAISAAGDRVGRSVSIDAAANTVIVGAPGTNTGAGSAQGAAYVYVRSGSTWTEAGTRLSNLAGLPGDEYGTSVSISPDGAVVLIGAPSEATNLGAVYVVRNPLALNRSGAKLAAAWKRTAGSFDSEQMVRVGGQIGDKFGASVSVSADGMAVGSPGVQAGVGAATIYREDEGGAYDPAGPELIPSMPIAGDKPAFGASLVMVDGVLVVGSPEMDIEDAEGGAAHADQGSASIFSFVFGLQNYLSPATTVTPETGITGDKFGTAVGAAGTTVGVGAPGTTVTREEQGDDAGVIDLVNQGGVYTFTGSKPDPQQNELDWSLDAFLTPDSGAAEDAIGRSIALDRGQLVAGAPLRDGIDGQQSVPNVGGVFVFEGIEIDIVFGTGFE